MPSSPKNPVQVKDAVEFPRPIDERDVLLAEVERVGQIGTWIQVSEQPMRWSIQLYCLLGLDPNVVDASVDALVERVHLVDARRVRAALEGQGSFSLEFRIVQPDGAQRWVRGSEAVFHDSARDLSRRVGTISDITESKVMQLKQKATLDKLSLSQQVSHTGSFECDPFSEEKSWSDELFRIYGLEPGPSLTWAEIMSMVHTNDRAAVMAWSGALTEGRQPGPLRYRVLRPDGELRHVENHGALFPSLDDGSMRIVGATIDVTGQVRAIEQQQHRAKLEAIGTLASGVAHELNNYLQLIESSLDLLHLQYPEQGVEEVSQANHAVRRAAKLTRQLLAFARSQPHSPQVLDLCALLENSRPLLQRLVSGRAIEFEFEVSGSPLFVEVDPTHVEGALMNLVTNARDAMPEGGVLRLCLETTRVFPHDVAPVEGMMTGRYARLSVMDTGGGISSEVITRIFEPYFTTKPRGKGTGLGLAAVYGAMLQNNGHVAVHSVVGEGTHFDLFFPIAKGQADTSSQAVMTSHGRTENRRIMVVEDIEGVRLMVCKILESQGHTTIGATHALEAVQLAELHALDLVVTDLSMPEVNGIRLAEMLRQDRPALKLLFIAGQVSAEDEALILSRFGARVLHKPFSIQALSEAITETLQSEAATVES